MELVLVFLFLNASARADLVADPSQTVTTAQPDKIQLCLDNMVKESELEKKEQQSAAATTLAKPAPTPTPSPTPFPNFVKVDPSALPSSDCQIASPKYFQSLKKALKNQVQDCAKSGASTPILVGSGTSGIEKVGRQTYCSDSNRLMACLAEHSSNFADFMKKARNDFDWYKSAGLPKATGYFKAGDFQFTSYDSTPPLPAIHPPCNSQYPYALRRAPANLIDPKNPESKNCGQDSTGATLHYCLKQPDGSYVPVPDRAGIEQGQLDGLTGKSDSGGNSMLLACVQNPVDADIMMIEGSGSLQFPDQAKPVQIGYSDQDGHNLTFLASVIKCNEWNGTYTNDKYGNSVMDLSTVKAADWATESDEKKYLSQLDSETQTQLRDYDHSYVFFQVENGGPDGARGFPVSPFTSLATDHNFIPFGTISLISTKRPSDLAGPCSTMTFMAVSQDSGGAIKGPHADIYSGSSKVAQQMANSFNEPGSMYISLPNQTGQYDLQDCASPTLSHLCPVGKSPDISKWCNEIYKAVHDYL